MEKKLISKMLRSISIPGSQADNSSNRNTQNLVYYGH